MSGVRVDTLNGVSFQGYKQGTVITPFLLSTVGG